MRWEITKKPDHHSHRQTLDWTRWETDNDRMLEPGPGVKITFRSDGDLRAGSVWIKIWESSLGVLRMRRCYTKIEIFLCSLPFSTLNLSATIPSQMCRDKIRDEIWLSRTPPGPGALCVTGAGGQRGPLLQFENVTLTKVAWPAPGPGLCSERKKGPWPLISNCRSHVCWKAFTIDVVYF